MFDISVYSEVTLGGPGKLAIAIGVDVTTSMSYGDTWKNVSESFEELMEDISAVASEEHFYVSLVPFTDRVNIGTSAARNSWVQNPSAEDREGGCVEPREDPVSGYPYAQSHRAPTGANRFMATAPESWGGRVQKYEEEDGRDWKCPHEIVGPTNRVKDIVDVFETLGPMSPATGRFDEGMGWLWRLLSINWHNQWGGKYMQGGAGSYERIAIFFTDGRTAIHKSEYDVQSNDPWGDNKGAPVVFEHLEYVCEEMKKDKIKVIVVYTEDNANATPYMQRCASENAYFSTKSGGGYQAAFDYIRNLGNDLFISR